MANHTITVINQGGSGNGGNSKGDGNVTKNGKSSSIIRHLEKKSMGQKVVNGIRISKRLSNGRILPTGSIPALAIATATVAGIGVGINIYSSIGNAKTGETMKYHNLKQGYNLFAKPFSYAKKAVWDYGYLAPMRIARQNETLNYDRQLTGNLILSKNYNNGTF